MQSSFLDRPVSTFGTYQMLAPPLQEAPAAHNSSHLQELYQNLPQLQNPIFSPVTYKLPQNSLLDTYSEQQYASLASSPSLLYTKLQSSNHNGKFRYVKHRPEQELDKDNHILHKRNGWGWDAGHGHGKPKHGNSPALSALALLGFMFFLNLIQTSLQNNRQMLAAAALNATTVSLVAGRENTYNRYRRSLSEQNVYSIPLVAPPHVTKVDADIEKRNPPHNEKVNNNQDQTKFMRRKNLSWTTNHKIGKDPLNKKSKHSPIELLKSSSTYCCQLVACKLGESIYDSLDATTGLMIRMLGSTIITKVPKTTWTGRLLRALDKGWKKKSCNNSFKNCFALYKLFNKATNTVSTRRERTQGKHWH